MVNSTSKMNGGDFAQWSWLLWFSLDTACQFLQDKLLHTSYSVTLWVKGLLLLCFTMASKANIWQDNQNNYGDSAV